MRTHLNDISGYNDGNDGNDGGDGGDGDMFDGAFDGGFPFD